MTSKLINLFEGQGMVIGWYFKENVVGIGYIMNWVDDDTVDMVGIDMINVKVYYATFVLDFKYEIQDLDSILQAAGCRHNITEPMGTCLDRLVGKIINLDFLKSR